MASSNHEARNSFLRSLIRARQFLLRFSSEKVAGKGKRESVDDEGKVFFESSLIEKREMRKGWKGFRGALIFNERGLD